MDQHLFLTAQSSDPRRLTRQRTVPTGGCLAADPIPDPNQLR